MTLMRLPCLHPCNFRYPKSVLFKSLLTKLFSPKIIKFHSNLAPPKNQNRNALTAQSPIE